MITLALELEKTENDDDTNYSTIFSNSKAEMIINESDINDLFELIYSKIISNIQKSLGKGSSWITDSVIDHNVNISKYNPLACCSYNKSPKELNHPKKA